MQRSLQNIRPVKVRSAASMVMDRLEALILDGTMRPGDQLPPEPELAAALGVGRSTVREAKKSLIARGLVEPRGRLGTYVLSPSTDASDLPAMRDLLANPALIDLHESREIIEVAAIRLAVERISDEEIAQLYALLDQIGAEIGTRDDGWSRLINFHRNLVRASDNKVLVSVFDLVAHLLKKHQLPFYGSLGDLRSDLDSHRVLVDLVARRDPDAAAAEMQRHLDRSELKRRSALDKARTTDGRP
jgi:GntR family transcriptional repressor for pyruvate dehydrogenase complex